MPSGHSCLEDPGREFVPAGMLLGVRSLACSAWQWEVLNLNSAFPHSKLPFSQAPPSQGSWVILSPRPKYQCLGSVTAR